MPIDPAPILGQRTWKTILTGPGAVGFTIETYADASTEEDADAVTQSLINHLAQWPDLVQIDYSHKMVVHAHSITPDGP